MTRTIFVTLLIGVTGLASALNASTSVDPTSQTSECVVMGATMTCTPTYAPSGALILGKVEEDGSARYTDGATFDVETGFSSP